MYKHKTPTWVFVVSSIIAGLIFYVVLFVSSKWFPGWTGRTLANEWTLILISAIPLLIVLAFMLAGNISKAKFAGIELEFDRQLPITLPESIRLSEQISRDYFMKGRRQDLDKIIQAFAQSSKHPYFLLVQFTEDNFRIDFKILRQYIYELIDIASVRLIIFVEGQNRYLGFTTIEKFKARFPRFGIELLLEDLEDERVRSADLPIFVNVDPESISRSLDRLIYRQWIQNWNSDFQDRGRVMPTDITRFGASDLKVNISASPTQVYWLLLENELDGIPVVNADGIFIGVVTKDRITQAVIKQLLEKSSKSES